MTNKAYVYLHSRLTDGVVFYVGMGTAKRAYSKAGRTSHWLRTVDKHGYEVTFAHTDSRLDYWMWRNVIKC